MDSILNLAVQTIGELVLKEAKFLHGVEDQVESMQRELIMMNTFLSDMEDLDDEFGDKRVKETTRQIRRIAYDAEDAIDSYILEVINPSKRKKDFFRRYFRFSGCLVNTYKAGTEMEVIKTRITNAMVLLKTYRGDDGIPKAIGEGRRKTEVWRPRSHPDTHEDHVVGLDEPINKLVSLLTSNESKIQVVLIAGMGGSGKTTLVRKLFKHERVEQCFGSKAWAPISQQYVVENGLLDLLKRISGDEVKNPQEALEKIYKYLEKRKYLIVLDDVWTKEALENILAAFPVENNGSKVIVTTRSRDVLTDPTLKVYIHEPSELTKDESWELFKKIALKDAEETISPMELAELEALGKEMLRKCNGLPLAIVALAGVLANKKTLEEWEMISKDVSSRVMEMGAGTQAYGAVNKMLSLSYNNLPRDLKPCFLYLGLFPEDMEIPIGMLIRVWIAEGFISSNNLKKGETLEDSAREYVNELIGRCLVRTATDRNYDGKAKAIEIHDLMRDLCIKKAKELEFLETVLASFPDPNTRVSQTRRMVVHSYDNRVFCDFSTDNRHLRSLFLFAIPYVGYVYSGPGEVRAQLNLLAILERFKLLRVLNLVSIKTSDHTLPEEIGSLILLRYLGLRATNINQLPSSIGNLRNLLTLDYRNISNYKGDRKIPSVVWEIGGLRHIYLPCDPQGGTRFDNLPHLQTLWVEGGSWMLNKLPQLSESVRKLHIGNITSNEQLQGVFQCPSIKFDCLHALYLCWDPNTEYESEGEGEAASEGEGEAKNKGEEASTCEDEGEGEDEGANEGEDKAASEGEGEDEGKGKHEDDDGCESESEALGEEEVVLKNLDVIAKSRHLRKLTLVGRIDGRSNGFQFPFGIKKLYLQDSKIETEATLEALGRLPILRVLVLQTDSYIGTKWTCSADLFSKLVVLIIRNLYPLKEWNFENGSMCQLKELFIGGCTSLKRLPEGLKFITTLNELELDDMKPEFYRRLRQEDGEDAHIIQHIPIVKFGDDTDD